MGGLHPDLLAEIKQRIRSVQYAALKAINQELVGLYWEYRSDDRAAAGDLRLGQGGGGTTRRRSTDGVFRCGRFFGLRPLAVKDAYIFDFPELNGHTASGNWHAR